MKRKKPVYAESSSDEDTPLASSPAKRTASAAVAMPGAAKATTIAASSINGNGRAFKKIETEDEDDRFGPDSPKKPATNGKAGKPPRKKVKEESDDFDMSSDDDKPIAARKVPVARKRKVKVESDADASSDDEKPIAKKPAPKPKPKAKKVKKEDVASGSDTPKAKKRVAKAKEENASPSKAKGKKKEKKEEDEEEVFRWWENNANGDGSIKWQTLEHNGVIFPPPYEPLPKNVKMKYNGNTILQNMGLNPLTHLFREGSRPPTSC